MTDIDSFTEWFDESSREAHKRASRTDQPSARVWQDVSAHLSQNEQPSPMSNRNPDVPDNQRKHAVDIAFSSPSSEKSRGVSAWVTVAAVVAMIVASRFYLNSLRLDTNESRMGWMPATGSPISTPETASACTVTPLTTDEVMETLRNPLQAYSRFGYDNRGGTPENTYLEVAVLGTSNWMHSSTLSSVSDTETEAELEAFGQMFWDCMAEGTFGQVWALLDPVLLQWSVLSQFPVIRSEESLLEFVEQWITTPYNQFTSDGTYIYTLPPAYAGRTVEAVDTEDYPILASEPDDITNAPIRYASITLLTTNPADLVNHFVLHVSQQPDGTWTVNAISTFQQA
ncbi:MAG: hypothetical protein M9934_07705 [Thermomicrobiales bacterium]|nr:hypothetical protein [Thermomicrobiales bacterium]